MTDAGKTSFPYSHSIIVLVFVGILAVLLTGCASTESRNKSGKLPGCCSRGGDSIRNNKPTQSCGAPVGSDISEVGFEWQNDHGEKIKLESLKGQIRVVSMFFATCQGICIITREDMEKIESSLDKATRSRVGFVLVTLDPARDSVSALKTYRADEKLSDLRWTLLRGDKISTRKLANFLGISYGVDSSGRFVHSSELVVLDDRGRILARHAGVHKDLDSVVSEIKAVAVQTGLALN